MTKWRLLVLAAGAGIVLIALLTMLAFFGQLVQSAALISPVLARVLQWLIILLLTAMAGALTYYCWLFLRRRPRRSRPNAPRSKTQAAAASLESLNAQIERVQDAVARQALQTKSQTLGAGLDRRDLRIVVFGVGSAGKTSLINALAGDLVSPVGAAMGTTQTPETHRLTLTDLDRDLILVDTPGIAEVGVSGTLREEEARRLAADADLLLFVVDNDLRQSEYGLLKALLDIGKRLLLVLNKVDRYPDPELTAILTNIRAHLPALVPDDVVAIAAAPHPVALTEGGWVQQEPNVLPLLERLAQVLRQEGDALIADTLLLQSQQLSDEARTVIDQQRQQQADAVVERYQWIGASVIALMPPGVDLLAAAAVNAQMVVELSRVYGAPVSLAEGKRLALTLARTLTGLGIVKGAMELLAWGLQTNLATVVAGRALQGVSAAYLTRIAGKSFIEYFRQNQDWGDGGMAEVLQEQFRLNQRQAFVKTFVQEAIARGFSSVSKNIGENP